MSLGHYVISPITRQRVIVADDQYPVDFYCPIDGTQLVEMPEFGSTVYDCVTCEAHYSVRNEKISLEELNKQARIYIERTRSRLERLGVEKSRLLSILRLAKHNSFD